MAVADVASRCAELASARTLGALSLILLHEAGHDLLVLNDLALAVAPRTVVHMVWVVSATTSAVGADGLLIVSQFEVLARE